MGYIVDALTTDSDGTATSSFDVALPAHQTGDLLLIFLTQDSGSTIIATASSGWAILTGQAVSGACRSAVAWKIAASSSEVEPTFTGTNDDWIATAIVGRGYHASAPIDVFSNQTYNNVGDLTAQQLTATYDNSTVIIGVGSDATPSIVPDPTQLIVLGVNRRSGASHMVGYREKATAGLTAAVPIYNESTGEGGNIWVVVLRDAGSGAAAPRPSTAPGAIIRYLLRTSQDTWQVPSLHFTTIDGIGVEPAGTQSSGNYNVNDDPWMPYLALTTSNNAAGNIAPLWGGAVNVLPAPVDLSTTGGLWSIIWNIDQPSRVNSKGYIVVFMDASNNWKAYRFKEKKGVVSGRSYQSWIDLDNATPIDSSGALDRAAVNRIALLAQRGATTGFSLRVKAMMWHTKADSVVGGSSGQPVTPVWLHTMTTAWGGFQKSLLQGVGQFVLNQHLQIGDGSTQTYWDANGASIEGPKPYSLVTNQTGWQVANNVQTITIKSSASDSIRFRNCLVVSQVGLRFVIAAAATAPAVYDFSGSYWEGLSEYVGKAGFDLDGAIFRACGTIKLKGSHAHSCRFRNGTDPTGLVEVEGGEDLTASEFITDVSTDYAIRVANVGGDIAIDLTNVPFTGFTTPINILKTSGTVTITLALGQTQPAYSTAGATVVFDQPTVMANISITGAVANSRILIRNTTTDTTIYNAIATSYDQDYTDEDPAYFSAGDQYRIVVTQFAADGSSAKKEFVRTGIASSAGFSILVEQEDDSVYNTHYAETGSGADLTGIEFNTSTIDIDLDGDVDPTVLWKEIYARYVYTIHTSTGIVNITGMGEATDLANFRFDASIVINNLGVASVKVGGDGFGRRKDGGSLFGTGLLQIDNGVGALAVETGVSGLTPTESTKLSSIDALSKLIPACIK